MATGATKNGRLVPGHTVTVDDVQIDGHPVTYTCLLYTSDAADERSSVDLGGRRIIKKKKVTLDHCAVCVPHNY